jgi:hypothetical protein
MFADVLQAGGGMDDGGVVGAELGQWWGSHVIPGQVGGHHRRALLCA